MSSADCRVRDGMEALRFRWSGSLSVRDSAGAPNAFRGGTMRRVLNSRIKSCERYTRKHDFAGEVCGAHQNGRAPAGAHRGWDPGRVFLVRAHPPIGVARTTERVQKQVPIGGSCRLSAFSRQPSATWNKPRSREEREELAMYSDFRPASTQASSLKPSPRHGTIRTQKSPQRSTNSGVNRRRRGRNDQVVATCKSNAECKVQSAE